MQQLSELKTPLKELEAKLASATKRSGDSKPPSSDIIDPPRLLAFDTFKNHAKTFTQRSLRTNADTRTIVDSQK